jgi:protein-tyrosine-phosphatase
MPGPEPIRVAFVCVENSCRSQIAEAFARKWGGSAVRVESAGSRPSGIVNPKAIESMARRGIDLSTHRSKGVDELAGPYDAIVTMGCGDACPAVAARRRIDWDIPDPKHMDPAEFDAVRDRIERNVAALLASLR